MHLIAPLMAGVKGAESGSVTVYQRGTTTPATCYTDFEGTSSFTAAGLSLDANGGRAIYVNELVRVIVLSSGGATIRDFVTGSAATAVEVRSASFNGAAYSGGAIAPGNPTTVKAVLDKWFTSAGAVDFNVLLNGSSASLQTALAAVAGLGLYVVTNPTYGAVGDGVTDDKAAIQAAINAANAAGGGVVFFPKGTYRVASSFTTYSTVTLRGVDRARSVIKIDHNASEQMVGVAPSACEDLGFTLNVARTFPIIDNTDGSAMRFSRCAFTASVATGSFVWRTAGAGQAQYVVEDCVVTVSGTFTGNLFKSYLSFANYTGNRFDISGVYNGTLINGSDANVASNTFFVQNTTAGTGIVADIYGGSITGNIFAQSTAAAWTLIDGVSSGSFCDVVEHGNRLSMVTGVSAKYGTPSGSNNDYRRLGSRNDSGKTQSFGAGVTSGTADILSYGVHRITNTGAPGGNFTINFTGAPNGSRTLLMVENRTGSSITYAWGAGHGMLGTTFAVAANSIRTFLLATTYDGFGGVIEQHTVSSTGGAEELT